MNIHYSPYEGDDYRYPLTSPCAAYLDGDCTSDTDLEFLAEEAAEDFHSEHDGWEGVWPRTITLYDGKNGPELGRFTVEREYNPSFSAARLAGKPDDTQPAPPTEK